jgi:hypothetical protein
LYTLAAAPERTAWMACGEGRLKKISFFTQLIETIKGWMGLGNRTDSAILEYEFIRLLGKGAIKGAFKQEHLQVIEQAARKIGILPFHRAKDHPELQALVNGIATHIWAATPFDLKECQLQLNNYYAAHHKALKPLIAPFPSFKDYREPLKENREEESEAQDGHPSFHKEGELSQGQQETERHYLTE